jgi:hypothetical protein
MMKKEQLREYFLSNTKRIYKSALKDECPIERLTGAVYFAAFLINHIRKAKEEGQTIEAFYQYIETVMKPVTLIPEEELDTYRKGALMNYRFFKKQSTSIKSLDELENALLEMERLNNESVTILVFHLLQFPKLDIKDVLEKMLA